MALNPLVSRFGRLVARSGRKRGNRQTDGRTDGMTNQLSTVTLAAHARRGLMRQLSNVCVDGTHGTNGYDFTLITVMVIDEYGEGFPVAWCISNREDQLLLILMP